MKRTRKARYLWLGKFKGFGTATFPRTVIPPLLAEAHLMIENKRQHKADDCNMHILSNFFAVRKRVQNLNIMILEAHVLQYSHRFIYERLGNQHNLPL